jgi:death-on-curing protein
VTPVEYLELDDLLTLVRALRAGPVRDIGLLDSAGARPKSSALGEDAYPCVELKAAALLHSMARNHPLVDGNKRLAWLATVVFLDLNGYELAATDDEAFDVVMAASQDELDVVEIAAALRAAIRPTGEAE